MRHLLFIGMWVTFWLTCGAGGAQAQPGAEPSDATVLRALAPPPAGVFRDDMVIVKEQVKPGRWKCTAHYTESIQLPLGLVPLGKKVQSVVIEPGRPMSAADIKAWRKF
jgi:hypothetical protein